MTVSVNEHFLKFGSQGGLLTIQIRINHPNSRGDAFAEGFVINQIGQIIF